MALSFVGNGCDGSKVHITVLGDGASTTLAVNLKSACFAPWFTDDNSVLPLQLYSATGTAYFDIPATAPNGQPSVTAITYTLAIATGTVTITFASAPPSGVSSKIVGIGLQYP